MRKKSWIGGLKESEGLMVAWGWLIVAFLGGVYAGMTIISLLYAARERDGEHDNND